MNKEAPRAVGQRQLYEFLARIIGFVVNNTAKGAQICAPLFNGQTRRIAPANDVFVLDFMAAWNCHQRRQVARVVEERPLTSVWLHQGTNSVIIDRRTPGQEATLRSQDVGQRVETAKVLRIPRS